MADEQVSTGPVDDGVSDLSLTDGAALYMAHLDAPEDDKDNEQPAESAEPATTEQESPSQEDDADADDNQPPGEDEDADPEDDKSPPISRPRSWAKEDQAEWDE